MIGLAALRGVGWPAGDPLIMNEQSRQCLRLVGDRLDQRSKDGHRRLIMGFGALVGGALRQAPLTEGKAMPSLAEIGANAVGQPSRRFDLLGAQNFPRSARNGSV